MAEASHILVMVMILLIGCIAASADPWPTSSARGAYSKMYGSARRGYHGGDMMEEAVRRVLDDTTTTYISYSALTADSVPCSTAGASYYACDASTAANPYTRSCTTITLCARDTS